MKKFKKRLGYKPNGGSSNKIVQGGFRKVEGNRPPDVFLQMPELFMFNMKDYMESVRSAKSVDFRTVSSCSTCMSQPSLTSTSLVCSTSDFEVSHRFPLSSSETASPMRIFAASFAHRGSNSCEGILSCRSSMASPSFSSTWMMMVTFAMTS